MKKLFTLFFLFLTSQTFSQTNFRFADSTAQWNVADYTGHQWTFRIITIIGLTR